MTLIEFYDKAALDNIAGTLLCAPERLFLVGDNKKHLQRSTEIYNAILQKKGIKTEIVFCSINKNNLKTIVALLSRIVEENEDCVFDLTGGEDLYLVAVGILMERYKGRIQCHRFNYVNKSVIDCDEDGNVCAQKTVDINIEDNILIYGGKLAEETYTGPIYQWEFTPELERDIETLWEIYLNNSQKWNEYMSTLSLLCDTYADDTSLHLAFNISKAQKLFQQKGVRYELDKDLLRLLEKRGLISSLIIQDKISFEFKNARVKRCLTVAGQVLELSVAHAMRSLRDTSGAPIYNDVRVGVIIVWSEIDGNEQMKIINEVDVMAMNGAIPIFVSCKNGSFKTNELYKLSMVAEHFGNKYAKKILVTTEMDSFDVERAKFLRARIDDFGIRRIEVNKNTSITALAQKFINIY